MRNLLVRLPREPHSIRRVEHPMGLSIAEVYLINHEAHGERSCLAEHVVFVPDVHVFHVHLNPVEERCQQGHPDWRIELITSFVL